MSKDFSLSCLSKSFSLTGFCRFFLPVLILLPANWLLEAKRWQLLLSKVQKVSLKDAFVSVLLGLTTAIMTPAQLGEFAGRLFFVDGTCRKKATLLWSLGGVVLTAALLVLGLFSVVYYASRCMSLGVLFDGFRAYILCLGIGCFFVVALLFVFIRYYKWMFQKVRNMLSAFSLDDLMKLFLLSFLRCLVFSVQLVLMLKFYGMTDPWLDIFACVCVSYLIITFVPSFFFSDAVVRSSVAVMVFSPFVGSSLMVVSASVSLWIINVAFPTFVGILLMLLVRRRS